MSQSTFSFELNTTDPEAKLGFEAWINDQCVFDTDHVAQSITVTGIMPDDDAEAEHTLKFVMKHKQTEHTQVSDTGQIVGDACLEISQLAFDHIQLGQMVNDLAVYQHDFNGSQLSVEEKFFGTMGCNGAVTLKFHTPMYLWLLEHM